MNDERDLVEEVCKDMAATGRSIDGEAIQLADSLTPAQLATIGMNALIDEATGYQKVRSKTALRDMAKKDGAV